MTDSQAISVSISDKALGDGGVRRGLRLLRDHGFTHVHFSQQWTMPEPVDEATITQWQEDLAATGMAVLDVHGCHPPSMNIWDEDPTQRAAALELFVSRLKLTHALGGDAMVYHVPTRSEPEPALIERFVDSLARVEDVARELGLKVALENHYLHDNDRVALSACFERFSAEYIGLTFDSGHAVRSGNTDWLIQNCFDRLTVLHLHDNEPGQDRHWLPGTPGGHVEWDKVAKAIAASPYVKPLQFEIGWNPKRHPDHLVFLKEAYRCAVELHETVQTETQRIASV